MLILKFVDLILIVVICSYIGISKSKKFSSRVKNLKNIKNALNMFKSKIEFTYEPIQDIFEEISRVIYLGNENIFKTFNENINEDDVSISWNNAVNSTKLNLSLEDKEIIIMLGKMLGKTDKAGQISEIELVNEFLNKQIEDAEESKRKNEKMYKTLGIISGLAISIILF